MSVEKISDQFLNQWSVLGEFLRCTYETVSDS